MQYAHLSETVKIKKVSENEKEGVFEIEGLYTGYGLTLGSALRRILLSSLPGAAITQVKIKGADHEFSAINGVKEDVLEITLNLKKIRFAFFASEPQVITLKAKGEREVKASDIVGNSQVEVVSPDIHIATLTGKNTDFEMEITVEKGLGYVPVEARKMGKLPIKTIALDALFSPVVKANFNVENMRVGERTDYNRLVFAIETDGTISPSSALHKACSILGDHIGKIDEVEVAEIKKPEENSEKKKPAKKPAKKAAAAKSAK
jgi:DNA-directed RNA polymerase subunit alpha